MPLSINPARRPVAEKQETKQDPFDRDLGRVLKALQVTNIGFDIAGKYQKSDENALKAETDLIKKDNETKKGLNFQLGIDKKNLEIADFPVKKQERTEKIEREIANEKFDNTVSLVGRSQSDPRYKDFTLRQNAIDNFKGLWDRYQKGELSPIDQHAMVIAYMKSQEPNSAVLGGEFDTLSQLTRGVFAKALDAPDLLTKGMILNDTQVEHIADNIAVVDAIHSRNKNDWETFYKNIATQNGLDPEQVIFSQKQLPAIGKVQTFPEDAIQQVMEKANNGQGTDRNGAILRLRKVSGGQ